MRKFIFGIFIVFCIMRTINPMTARAAEYTDYNVYDTLQWSLTTMEGKTINENTYAGKLRIFTFVTCTCPNSARAVRRLANSEWISNDDIKAIVVFDDISTMEEKQNFIKLNAANNNDIIFAYGDSSGIMRMHYMRNTLNPSVMSYAICAVVDKNNIIRRAMESCSYSTAETFYNSAVNDYLYVIEKNDMLTFDIDGTFDYDEAYNVFTELNALRGKLGLSALTLDKELMDAAMQRAAEISIYFSHTRPNGTDPYTVFPFGASIGAENVAIGQSNANEAMKGWTNSPGHYKNMTLNNIDTVGIGCFYQEDGTRCWVQLFQGGRKAVQENRTGKEVRNAKITALGSMLDIKILPSSSTIGVTETQKYELYNTNKEFNVNTRIIPKVYSSSDTTVATVDSKGMVTGVKEGTAWISLGIKEDLYWKIKVNVTSGYKITFDANGGKGAPAPQLKLKNKSLKLSTAKPTRANYSFLGWATDPNAKQPTYKAGDTLPEKMNNDLQLYALWKPTYCYISFNLQGGAGNLNTQVVFYDVLTKLITKKPIRTGYQFLGWATTKGAKTAKYKPGDTITVKSTQFTLYAVWKKSS